MSVDHVSIVNPSLDSELPYFRAKGIVERELRRSGLSHAIVRPTVLFGRGDVLINNISCEDVARTCVEAGRSADDVTVDVAAPEIFMYEELVRLIAAAVGRPRRIVHLSSPAVRTLLRAIGAGFRDAMLARDELTRLVRGLLVSGAPAMGTTLLRAWLDAHADGLGIQYASELARHDR